MLFGGIDRDAGRLEPSPQPFRSRRLRRNEIHESTQGGWHEPPGEVETGTLEAHPPFRQDRLERPRRKMRSEPVLERVDEATPGTGELDCRASSIDTDDEPTDWIHRDHLPVLLKLPIDKSAAGEAKADAVMLQKIVRMLRRPTACKIRWRRCERSPLPPRSDWNGNHVLCQMLPVAYARITPGRNDIDEPVLDHAFEAHAWMLLYERVYQGRKDVGHHRAGDVEPQES